MTGLSSGTSSRALRTLRFCASTDFVAGLRLEAAAGGFGPRIGPDDVRISNDPMREQILISVGNVHGAIDYQDSMPRLFDEISRVIEELRVAQPGYRQMMEHRAIEIHPIELGGRP